MTEHIPPPYSGIPDNTAGRDFLNLHPFVRMIVHDKIRGALFGSALGDSIGLYTEFLSKDIAHKAYPDRKFQLVDPVTEFRSDGHRDRFEPGSWTDDTDHALLILLSYLHSDGKTISPQDVAERLGIWVDQGLRVLERLPLGLGQTVGRVVLDKGYLTNPSSVAYKHWIKSGRKVAPNGSLMRTHPLGPICFAETLEDTFKLSTKCSLITHADPRCVVACCIQTGLIRGILRADILGENAVNKLIVTAYEWVNARLKRGQMEDSSEEATERLYANGDLLDEDEFKKFVYAKSFDELELDDDKTIGYVYKCLGAAILSLRLGMTQSPCAAYDSSPAVAATDATSTSGGSTIHNSAIFENIITSLTYEAGDADTNACAAGALLGCWLGYDSLPSPWRDGMQHREWLKRKSDNFSETLGVINSPGPHPYKGSDDPDTRVDGGKGLLDRDAIKARDLDFMERYMKKTELGMERERLRLEKEKKSKSSWSGIFRSVGR